MIDDKTIKKLLKPRPKTPNIITVELAGWSEGERSLFGAPEQVRGLAQGVISEFDDHAHLREAHLLLLMQTGLKPNADNLIELGKARKMSGLSKSLFRRAGEEIAPDFTITLNGDQWGELEEWQQLGLLDHELMHCAATIAGKYVPGSKLTAFVKALGKDHLETCDGVTDEHGRVLVRFRKRKGDVKPGDPGYFDQPLQWRVRKHDVEEFVNVFERWGRWTPNLARMVDVMEEPDDGQLELGLASPKRGQAAE